jgi:peptidyl-dipeptidase Dcp
MLEARGLIPGDEAADSEVADDGPATVGDAGGAGGDVVR